MARTCGVEGCDRRVKAKGYCNPHYMRWKRTGNPDGVFQLRCDVPKFCTVDGCNRSHDARGLCSVHLGRLRHHGDALATPSKASNGSRIEWLRANKNHQGTECLFWPFPERTNRATILFSGKSIIASRVMCMLAHGNPPADGLVAAHSCGNGHLCCLNPRHLRWATYKENQHDSLLHGTRAWGERNGHSKLTDRKVRAIRTLALPAKELAQLFNVSEGTVNGIRAGRRWGLLT